MKRILVILLTAIGLIYGANAQSVAPRAVASLDSAKMLMGNLVGMNVKVTAQSDSSRIEFPLTERLHGNRYTGILNDSIEVTNPYTVDTVRGKLGTEFNFKFYIQAFDSGKYVLPPFQIKVDGQPIETNALHLEVLPVKVKADDKIDPFSETAEPFELLPDGALEDEGTGNGWIIWLIVGCVVILLILAYLFIRYKKTGSILFRRPLAPYEVALKQLDKLQNQKLWEKGKVKTYYTRLIDILRRYLNKQFDIKTLERTTSEILADVEKNPDLEMYGQTLTQIFSTADFVKFAKVTPTEEENTSSMRLMREFIIESRPIETEPVKPEKVVIKNPGKATAIKNGNKTDSIKKNGFKEEKGGEK